MKQVTQQAWPVHPDNFSNAEGGQVPDGNWAVKALHLVKSLSQCSWSARLLGEDAEPELSPPFYTLLSSPTTSNCPVDSFHTPIRAKVEELLHNL